MSDQIWVTQSEFQIIFNRSRQLVHHHALEGNFADFGIPTLRVLHSYGRRSRWFFLIPHALLPTVSNSPLPPSSKLP